MCSNDSRLSSVLMNGTSVAFVLFWFRHVAVPFQDTSAIMQDDPPLLQPAPPQFVGKSPVSAAVAILKVGWPMAISQAAYWVQNFVTIWLLGANGKKLAMAGYGLANVLCNVTGHCFLWGIGAGIDTLASQAWGAKEHLAIGLINQRALLILTLLVNVPVVAIWLNATPILLACRQDPAVASQVGLFARIRIPGLFAQGVVCCASKTLQAMGKTRWLAVSNVLGIVLSVGLAWLFIAASSPLSHYLSPIAGSALMSTLTDCVGALALLLVAVCDEDCRRCWPGWSAQCWRGWKPYLRLSVPAMLMGIFEWWSWDLVTFLAGLCPDPQTALAANALLGSAIMAAYALPIGLQAGVQTLVGNALGAQSPREARLGAKVGGVLAICCMVAQCSLLYTFRRFWASLFRAEPTVGKEVASLLRWTVFFCAGDGLQIVLTGVITGAGKQAVTTPILCIAYWVLGLPLGALAAFSVPRNGLLGLWWGMTGAVWLHVLAYAAICFGAPPCIPFAIHWADAARQAADRLAEPVAAGSGANDGMTSALHRAAVAPLVVADSQGTACCDGHVREERPNFQSQAHAIAHVCASSDVNTRGASVFAHGTTNAKRSTSSSTSTPASVSFSHERSNHRSIGTVQRQPDTD